MDDSKARDIVEHDRITKEIESQNVRWNRRSPVTDQNDPWNKLVNEAQERLRNK